MSAVDKVRSLMRPPFTGIGTYTVSDPSALVVAEALLELATRLDKVEGPPPRPSEKANRQTSKVWINVYSNGYSDNYASRKEADELACPSRIACIEREIEFTPGEGLSYGNN